MSTRTEQMSSMIDKLLDSVYEWEDKVNAFTATSEIDDEIVVTHDGRGRLIGCDIPPGLHERLSVEEFEEAMNEAIAKNAQRAYDGIQELAAEFRAKWASIPEEFANHPVAAEFSAALRGVS
ncbi:hypothetical protein [Mycobacteroides abscessus]|uniref:hypothetical protein n=1 Tax=Mycobacteroides abscessus TaxID=36809 RepID=UPI0009A6B1CD|nr:hypothetical protein [Mycobacteroides abscessus]SLJ76018.1 Uncharacterised protein [Mycobacteroides abscessus subsp. abscessus]SLJ77752.1 Uncharacterised protein [Mycobacteroides abscessus subsp. abscessus]